MSRVKDWPLLSYATQYWPHHTKASTPLSTETWNLIKKLFSTKSLTNGGNYSAWIELLAPDSIRAQRSPPLYYAASFGLYEVVKQMLEENPGMDIEAKGGRYNSSAMHVAIYRQRNDVAKLLIEAGANVNDRNSLGESVLLWAYLVNNFEMRSLLHDRGAHLSASDMADPRFLDLGNDLVASADRTEGKRSPEAQLRDPSHGR